MHNNYNKTHISKARELENCTFIKTVLMIIIVLFHSIVFWRNDWLTQIGSPVFQSEPMRIVALWLASFHTHTFTLVSGYIFFYIKFEKHGYDNRKLFIKNKIKRLLVPYLFVCAIWVVPAYEFFSHDTASKLFFKYALGESPSQLWFLLMLFNVFWIIDIGAPIIFRNLRIGTFIVLLLYLVGLVGNHFLPNYFQIFTSFKYIVFFYTGALFRKYDLCRKINIKIIIIGIIVNIGLLLLHTYYSANKESLLNQLIYSALDFWLHTSSSVFCFCALQNISNRINFRRNKIYGLLSKNSMGIYLFHEQIIYFSIFFFNGLLEPHLNATINFIVSLTISLVISYVLSQFKFTKLLIGEK